MRSALAAVARRIARRQSRRQDSTSVPRPAAPLELELSRILASSFEDGTPRGSAAAARYLQLSALVCGLIGRRYGRMAVQMQRLYRCHDPSLPLGCGDAAMQSSMVCARQFSTALHKVLTSAGFQLCSREEELETMHGHFGDEYVWNVPVTMDWDQLDDSLVDESKGGFDAYQRQEVISRPSWAHKLLLYRQGEVVVEKQGYFIVAKLEEMSMRTMLHMSSSLLSGMQQLLGYSIAPLANLAQRARRHLEARMPPSYWVTLRALSLRFSQLQNAPTGAEAPTTLQSPLLVSRAAASTTSLAMMPLSWRSLFERTTLRAPAFAHVLVAYRHSDAESHAHGKTAHIALGLFRRVPMVDLELLLPHQQVCMPAFQRSQFALMGVLGLLASHPLLHQEPLSLTGLLTLYTCAMYATRTAVRWRSAKQLYQQLLLSYQSANRLGSSDGALLYVVQLAEMSEKQNVLLSLRALLQGQLDGEGGLTPSSLLAHNRRLLNTWSQLSPLALEEHCTPRSTLEHLSRLGLVVEIAGANNSGEPKLLLKPLDEALDVAKKEWAKAPESFASRT